MVDFKSDMSKKHLRQTVRDLFMDGKTYKEIEEITGVSPQTQCKWVQKYNWKEQRDKIETDSEIISEKLRAMWATNLLLKEKRPDGTYPMDWDAYCKASKTISNLGDVDDNVRNGLVFANDFSKFVQSQNYSPQKSNHCFSAIKDYMDHIGRKVY